MPLLLLGRGPHRFKRIYVRCKTVLFLAGEKSAPCEIGEVTGNGSQLMCLLAGFQLIRLVQR